MPDVAGRDRFLQFYDDAVGPLFRYLYRASGGDRDLAEDIAQDVFAVTLQRVKGGDLDVMALPWVITVGRNRLVDHWRRLDRERRRTSELRLVDPSPPDHDDALLGALAALPPMQRAAVALRYVDDLTVDDVAHRLGKSVKATESLLSRGRQSLRDAIPRDERPSHE